MATWIIVSILLTVAALAALAVAINRGIAKSADQAGYEEDVAENGEDDEMAEFHHEEQSKLLAALIIAIIIAVACAIGAGICWANPGLFGSPEDANAQQQGSQSDDSAAGSELGYYLVEKVNAVQVKQVLGEGDITTSPEVRQDYVTKVTGYEDGYAAPYSSKNLDETAAGAETADTIFNKATRKGNVDAAYGYVAAIIYTADLDLGKMPELRRLMDIYPAQGAEAFYEHEGDQIKVAKADDSFFYNEDGKLLLAIAYTLFSDGHLRFYGVEHHQTRVNWHSNAAMVDSDRRIELNPIQYEGDFYVWGYEWKGYVFERFGTNCGADNGLGCGDKRPALFAYPPETTPSGGNPGTGGNPPINPPTDNQNVKDPDKGSAPSGNAPVGGGKGKGTTPLEDDHSAASTGASPDAGNSDGMDKPSNQIQDPSAAQDNSRPPAIPEDGITDGATSAHTDTGVNTDDQTYSGTVDI